MKNDRCIPGGQRSFWVLCMHTMRYRQSLRMALRVSATGIFQNSQHTVRGILQFNPISNVGGGHLSLNRCGIACEFQSTSPVWGMTATLHGGIPFCAAYFYILCPFFWAYRPSFLFPYWIFFPDLAVFLRESPYDFLFAWGSRGFFTGSGLRSDRSWAWHRCA